MRSFVIVVLGLAIGLGLAGCGGGDSGKAGGSDPSTSAEGVGDVQAQNSGGGLTPVVAAEEGTAADPEYVKFRDLFPHAELPHAISPDMDLDVPAIPMDLQQQFFEHTNDSRRPYGRFDMKAGFDCLVTVEDPVDGVHYIVLNVFTPDGKRKGMQEVAGHDGTEYSGFLRGDGKVRVTEAAGGVSGLKEAKVRVYGIQEDGSVQEEGE